jgi:hypothetical protein
MRRAGESANDNARELRIEFNRPQSRAYATVKPGHTTCCAFARGVGKSWFFRQVAYLLIAEWDGRMRPSVTVPGKGLSKPKRPGVRGVFLMPTLEQFRKVHLPDLLTDLELAGDWAFLRGEVNKTTLRVAFPGGSWIQIVSAEAAQGARGMRCDFVIPDECDDIDPEIVESVTQPWFTEPHSLRITLLGGTPKRGRHGLLWRAYHEWPSDPKLAATHHSVHATCYEAPRQVDPAYIETQVLPKTRQAIFKREYLCDFDAAEGLVYQAFTASFHVREPDYGIPWSEVLVGVDHGTSDPGVYLVLGVLGNGRDAIVHALEEVYQTDQDTTWWMDQAEVLARRYARFRQRWYADPSRPDRIMDIRRRVREKVKECGPAFSIEEGKNEIEAGVDALADRIALRKREVMRPDMSIVITEHARFYVSTSCKNTIREFGLYKRKRDPRNVERVLDDILDKDNHAMDAARYAVFTRFGGPDRRRHEVERHGATRVGIVR